MFLTHRPVRILLVLAAVVMLGGACAQVEPPQQSLDTEEFKQKISEYLTRLNKKLDRVQVEEVKRHEESSLVSVKLTFKIGEREQTGEAFVTDNGRHLILGQQVQVWDMEVRPEVARWRRLSKVGEGNLEKLDLTNRPVKGNPDAEVVVVEFSDYQCPYCATAYSGFEKQLMEKYGDRIRFVFKHLPLTSIHPWALKASVAATCAYEQEPAAFWEIHNRLFENQKEITLENLRSKAVGFVEQTDLNEKEFLDCFDNEKTRSVVMNDVKEASQLKVTSTPTFLLNGAPFRGAPDFEEFSGFIEMALEEASAN